MLGVVLLMMVSILATGSRGGLGALLIGAGIFWLLTRMRHKYLLASVAVVAVVTRTVALSLAGASSTERYTGESGGKSLVYRLGWTKMAFVMIGDHPFVGVGTGNFVTEYNRYCERSRRCPAARTGRTTASFRPGPRTECSPSWPMPDCS